VVAEAHVPGGVLGVTGGVALIDRNVRKAVLGQAHTRRIRLLVRLRRNGLREPRTSANAMVVQVDGRILIAGERDDEFTVAAT
jgi:hypothetical protein